MDNITVELDEIIDIFGQINNESSNNKKIDLIKRYSENTLFLDVLKFVYDDFITSGVSSSTLRQNNNIDIEIVQQGEYTLEDILKYLKEHNTGSFSTIGTLLAFMEPFNYNEREFLIDVFSKELKVGITAKTINKALGKGFIREFNVQLAYPYHKYADKVAGKEFVLTQKLDGHRSVFISDGNQGQFYTRKGLPIYGLDILTQQAEYLAEQLGNFGSIPYVLDGELLLHNTDQLETKDLFRATSRILRSDSADKSNIEFNLFDAIPAEDFYKGVSEEDFKTRKEFFSMGIEGLKYDSPKSLDHINLVKNLYVGTDISMINKLQHDYVDKYGWEGLMLNLADGHYVTKRTNTLLKIKEFYSADVKVIDVFEGEGKLSGMLGGIVIDYKGFHIKVGSGFTQKDREYYWEHKDEIIGSLVEISYFEETHNQNDDDISLRFPTFVTIRYDKEASSYEV